MMAKFATNTIRSEVDDLQRSRAVHDVFCGLPVLDQQSIDWFLSKDVPARALCNADRFGHCLKLVHGDIAGGGWFDQFDEGGKHIAILICDGLDYAIDIAVWQPRSGKVGTFRGRAFAFGEVNIMNPGTYCFDGALRIHRTPLEWLRADRDGICIIKEEWASCRLQRVPRLATTDVWHGQRIRQLVEPQLPKVLVPQPICEVA